MPTIGVVRVCIIGPVWVGVHRGVFVHAVPRVHDDYVLKSGEICGWKMTRSIVEVPESGMRPSRLGCCGSMDSLDNRRVWWVADTNCRRVDVRKKRTLRVGWLRVLMKMMQRLGWVVVFLRMMLGCAPVALESSGCRRVVDDDRNLDNGGLGFKKKGRVGGYLYGEL